MEKHFLRALMISSKNNVFLNMWKATTDSYLLNFRSYKAKPEKHQAWMGFETVTMSFYRCSALPTESSRQLGGGNYICEFVTVIISLSSSTGILPIHTSQFPAGLTAHLVEHSYHKAMGSNPLHFFQAFFMHQDFFLCGLMPHWGCYRWRDWVSE